MLISKKLFKNIVWLSFVIYNSVGGRGGHLRTCNKIRNGNTKIKKWKSLALGIGISDHIYLAEKECCFAHDKHGKALINN